MRHTPPASRFTMVQNYPSFEVLFLFMLVLKSLGVIVQPVFGSIINTEIWMNPEVSANHKVDQNNLFINNLVLSSYTTSIWQPQVLCFYQYVHHKRYQLSTKYANTLDKTSINNAVLIWNALMLWNETSVLKTYYKLKPIISVTFESYKLVNGISPFSAECTQQNADTLLELTLVALYLECEMRRFYWMASDKSDIKVLQLVFYLSNIETNEKARFRAWFSNQCKVWQKYSMKQLRRYVSLVLCICRWN